ncbi:hypothetical protein PUN28_012800 [Cardiocondyla obscurior]|uniref:Uncharacterized protein n=1 Tax=Cardiocondyla obscurior TaxID=286306 RepID=A0AAW2FA15_9HYME
MTIVSTVGLSMQIGLRSIGIWPNAPYAFLFRGAWILTTGIVQTFQYWWVVIHFGNDDMSHLIDGLSVTVEYTLMSLKLIILWLNSRIFYDVLAAMAADWKEAAINEMQTMTSKANISRYIANVIIGLHSAAVIVYVIDVLVFRTSNYNVDGIETSVREFTLKLQLPFECNESPLYEVIMLLEFLHQLVASATNGVLNCLIITLSKMIGDAAYNSIWYDFKLNECKLVLFIILRSQRRLTITAGKMMDLSLEGFTSIMKASLSYVSILHAMY